MSVLIYTKAAGKASVWWLAPTAFVVRASKVGFAVGLDLVVCEHTSVGSGHSAEAVRHASEVSGAASSETVHVFLNSLGLLLDVLDGETATGGLHNLELVAISAV